MDASNLCLRRQPHRHRSAFIAKAVPNPETSLCPGRRTPLFAHAARHRLGLRRPVCCQGLIMHDDMPAVNTPPPIFSIAAPTR